VARYQALSAHTVNWTDPTVTKALATMAVVLGDTSNIYGGTSGAVKADFPTSVNNVLRSPPKAAMVIEGDCVPDAAAVKAKPDTEYNVFPFPAIDGSGPEVVIGGDRIVAFRDSPAIEAFVKFLTTPPGCGGMGDARRLRHR
jgi:alpha-glucoside transport system substrate-binding protein